MDPELFLAELAKLRPSATFLTLQKYRNAAEEVADYNLIFHISYENALKKSIAILESLVPDSDLQLTAKHELLMSWHTSVKKLLTTPIEELEDAYDHFFEAGKPIKGVKVHRSSGTLHLYGLVAQKRVLTPGNYKKVNSQLLTIEKNKLTRTTPVGNFRQFKVLPNQVGMIKVEKLALLPPSILY